MLLSCLVWNLSVSSLLKYFCSKTYSPKGDKLPCSLPLPLWHGMGILKRRKFGRHCFASSLSLLHGRGSSSWVLCSKTNHCHIDRPTRELAPWHAKLSTEFPQALTEILEMVRLRLHEVCSCCSLTVLTGPAIDLLKYVLRIFKWTVYFLPTLLWCKSQYSSHSSQLYIKVNKEACSMTDNRCTNLRNSYTSSVLSQKRIKWQLFVR